MKIGCLKCGATMHYWGGFFKHKTAWCPNCDTVQPTNPIVAAIWMLLGMKEMKP